MKFDGQKMDLENLDELIAKCEDAMVRPFSKKKEAAVIAIEPDGDDAGKDEADAGGDKPDLSDSDMEDLVRMYQELKDRK